MNIYELTEYSLLQWCLFVNSNHHIDSNFFLLYILSAYQNHPLGNTVVIKVVHLFIYRENVLKLLKIFLFSSFARIHKGTLSKFKAEISIVYI